MILDLKKKKKEKPEAEGGPEERREPWSSRPFSLYSETSLGCRGSAGRLSDPISAPSS